jgi:hypothetical protein
MQKLVMLANPNSPHVVEWVDHLSKSYSIEMLHCEYEEANSLNVLQTRMVPKLLCKSKILRYILLGILLRFINISFVHAHNGSGYGLSALLSGKKYILTTYGSEVYRATGKNSFYNYVIIRTLAKAESITCSSKFMEDFLTQELHVPRENIYRFPPTVNAERANKPRDRDEILQRYGLNSGQTIWVSNRRMMPLYRIENIVAGFVETFANQPSHVLILLEGVSDKEYVKSIQQSCKNHRNIIIMEGFLDKATLYDLLFIAHFVISIPRTDQLSASIVEALYFDNQLLLSDEPKYWELKDFPITWVHNGNVNEAIKEAANFNTQEIEQRKSFTGRHFASTFDTSYVQQRIVAMIANAYSDTLRKKRSTHV